MLSAIHGLVRIIILSISYPFHQWFGQIHNNIMKTKKINMLNPAYFTCKATIRLISL